MPAVVKIAIFWLIVWAVLWLLRRHPNSPAAQLAFSWLGPYPRVGEKKSQFYFRVALFALTWLMRFLTALAVGVLLVWVKPEFSDTTIYLLIFAFALPMAAGIALLGALFAAAVALKAKIFEPNAVFKSIDVSE